MKYIIAIEGTDGCGKHTQTELLFKALRERGEKVMTLSFPNYDSNSSVPVKMYLNGEFGDANSLDAYQSSTLFAVDRLCTIKQAQKQIEENDYLILDRYTQSNMLHQAGKIINLEEKDKFLKWLEEFEFNTLKLPQPTTVIFLKVPVNVSKKLANARSQLKSGTKKDVHEMDETHLQNAFNSGMYVAEKYHWNIIDCLDENGELKSVDAIHNMIMKCIDKSK